MTLPPNFGRAVDLSSLGKPKPEPAGPMPGIEITPENLTNEFLALSKAKPVVLICWSPRSPESQEVVAILGKLALADQGSWVLGRVDVGLHGLSLLATNQVLYHSPQRRPLHDVMTAIRHKTTVAAAGHLLHPNAERHLKSPAQMQRLFARWPHAIRAAREVADRCQFSLDELRYEYPEDIYPDGQTPQQFLETEVWAGAERRYPDGLPETVRQTLARHTRQQRGMLGQQQQPQTLSDYR